MYVIYWEMRMIKHVYCTLFNFINQIKFNYNTTTKFKIVLIFALSHFSLFIEKCLSHYSSLNSFWTVKKFYIERMWCINLFMRVIETHTKKLYLQRQLIIIIIIIIIGSEIYLKIVYLKTSKIFAIFWTKFIFCAYKRAIKNIYLN